MPGGVEVLKITDIINKEDPTSSKPYVRFHATQSGKIQYSLTLFQSSPAILGQYNTEAILRKHIERFGVSVEYGTELSSLESHLDHVQAVLVKKAIDGNETEEVTCHWLVGTDGAKSTKARSPMWHLPRMNN